MSPVTTRSGMFSKSSVKSRNIHTDAYPTCPQKCHIYESYWFVQLKRRWRTWTTNRWTGAPFASCGLRGTRTSVRQEWETFSSRFVSENCAWCFYICGFLGAVFAPHFAFTYWVIVGCQNVVLHYPGVGSSVYMKRKYYNLSKIRKNGRNSVPIAPLGLNPVCIKPVWDPMKCANFAQLAFGRAALWVVHTRVSGLLCKSYQNTSGYEQHIFFEQGWPKQL